MSLLIQIAVGVVACLVFGGLILSQTSRPEVRVMSQDDQIDANNSYQIGYLVGMTRGAVSDTIVIRQALERFEQTHGYKPTLRDACEVVELMHAPR